MGGHIGASYVLGVILICRRDESMQLGLQLMSNVKTSLQRRECRKTLKKLVDSVWNSQNKTFLKPKLLQCQFPYRKRSAWTLISSYNDDCDDNSDLQCCETCKLNQEIVHVCNTLNGCFITYLCNVLPRLILR